jgi:uncharacterized protein
MFIRFKVSNSRSISQEIELSAISTQNTPSDEKGIVYLPKYDVYLLKVMALFGANASGKSNILKAIADMIGLVIFQPDDLKKRFHYCKNDKKNEQKPITYSLDFLVEDTYYNYSFSHNDQTITYEQLVKWHDNLNSELIFSRILNEDNKYTWSPKSFFENENVDYFYKSTPKHKLFLAVANNPINSDAIQKIKVLDTVYQWFAQQLNIYISLMTPGKINYDYFITFVLQSENNKQVILKLLEIADIPIANIEINEIVEVAKNQGSYRYTKPNGSDVYVEILTTHKNIHTNSIEKFDFFNEESHGTQQFIAWVGSWLLDLKTGKQPKTFIVDELGTNLHPLLNQLLVKIFYATKINAFNSQLIFTSHEVKLMDQSIMRPDQLFLVNKSRDSKEKSKTTYIQRVSDFQDINQYHRLDNLYMHSGLSGVPAIQGNTDIDAILNEILL